VTKRTRLPKEGGDNIPKRKGIVATKNKTNRSLKKRFKITGTGKLKHSNTKRRHLLAGRRAKNKRQARQPGVTTGPTADKYITAMGGL